MTNVTGRPSGRRKSRWIVTFIAAANVVVTLACRPRVHSFAGARDAKPPASTEVQPGPPSSGGAWVPRIAPPPFELPEGTGEIFAPERNNFGTGLTVYLGGYRAGLLNNGQRFVWQGGSLHAVDAPTSENHALNRVRAIPRGLGSGFVFLGKRGVFFADTFEAPLRQLSDHRALFDIAPNSVLIEGKFVSTKDGKRVAGSPENVKVYAHPRGFAVAISEDSPNMSWFTNEGQSWRPIALENVGRMLAIENGDALVFVERDVDAAPARAVRVGRDATVADVSISREEIFQRQILALSLPLPGAEEPFEGSLWDALWVPTGRSDDEWFRVQENHVCIAHVRTRERRCFEPTVGEAGACSATRLGGQPLVVCTNHLAATLAQGSSVTMPAGGQQGYLKVFRVDLDAGATSVERNFELPLVGRMGTGSAPGLFPLTLVAERSCENPVQKALCVRRDTGEWETVPALDASEQGMPFPGELLGLFESNTGQLRLRALGTPRRRTFAPREIIARYADMGLTLPLPKGATPPVTRMGVLRTAAGIRVFYGPTAFKPLPEPVQSFAFDVPLKDQGGLTVTAVPGVVAVAGMHALRLAGAQLWETNDGWNT